MRVRRLIAPEKLRVLVSVLVLGPVLWTARYIKIKTSIAYPLALDGFKLFSAVPLDTGESITGVRMWQWTSATPSQIYPRT